MKSSRTEAVRAAAPEAASLGVVLALLACILLLAISLRAFRIGSKGVWVDEANAVVIADHPLDGIVSSLRPDSSPPLYYFLLHLWIGMFGYSEAALRALSALFGVLLVASAFVVGRQLFSPRAGLYAALFVAVSPVQVLYSQEMRMYSLLPLVALWAIAFTIRCAREGGAKNACGAVLFTAAALYTHNYGLFLLPAVALIAIGSRESRARIGLWAAVGTGVAALYLPWVPILLSQLANTGQYAWFLPFWKLFGLARMLLHTGTSFAFGVGGLAYLNTGMGRGMLVIALLSFCVVAFAVWVARRDEARGPAARAILAYLLVPLAAAGVLSCVSTPCYVAGRCDQLVFPAFVLLLALGLDSIGMTVFRGALLAGILVCAGFTLHQFYDTDPKAGDREYAKVVLANAKPGEAVLCTSLTRASLEYYMRLAGKPLSLLSYPRETAEHLGNQDDSVLLERAGHLEAEAEAVLEEAKRLSGPRGSFLVLTSRLPVNTPLRTKLERLIQAGSLALAGNLGDFQQALVREPVIVMRFRFVTSNG